MKIILIILSIIIAITMFGMAYSKYQDQNPIHELRTERIYEMHRYKDVIGIYCIDGYKWIMTVAGVVQFFKIDSKGNMVPARCDE